MLARCTTYQLDGITARRVTVECDIGPGVPSFTILGLSHAATRDLRETVRAAIQSSGYAFPKERITLNVAPARLRRTFPTLPLAVAAAILAAAGEIPPQQIADAALYGELTLAGDIAPLPGTLAAAAAHRASGRTGPLLHSGKPLPHGNLAPNNSQAVAHLTDLASPSSLRDRAKSSPHSARSHPSLDYADVRGHDDAIFALTVAAAGGHSVLLRGGPGCGATMLARRLVTILPDLTADEQREVATIRDAAGLGRDCSRPFRAPHHTISAAGLAGGGSPPRPGEVTLAHRGVLFLSDLPEFSRSTLEALRAPIDDANVVIVRGTQATRFPANFQLVASASPCPSGHANSGLCRCDPETLARYQRRLPASLLDRFAITIDLPSATEIHGLPPAPSSAELRERVRVAHERYSHAAATINEGGSFAETGDGRRPVLSGGALSILYDAYTVGSISHRGRKRILAVAQTVADLAGEDIVTAESLNTALALSGRQAPQLPSLRADRAPAAASREPPSPS